MWKLGLLVFFLLGSFWSQCFSNISDFEKLSDKDLIRLHEIAFLRIDAIDKFREAEFGIKPEPSFFQRQFMLQKFASESQIWTTEINFNSLQDTACTRYIRNFKNLLKQINEDYQRIINEDFATKKGLVLRTRIEALQLLLKGEIALANENSEAGETPLTGLGRQCTAINRAEWSILNHRIENSLDLLNKSWWGERGLTNAFPLSLPLMKIIIHEGDIHYQWAVPTFILHAIVPVVAVEFITEGLLPGVEISSGMTRNLLRFITAGGSAAYGAYKGYQFGSINFQPAPYIGDKWNQIQYSTEKLLNLSLSDTQLYYEIASEIENATLEFNQNTVRALRPQMIIAHDRFGSLDAARSLAVKKLKEINFVVKQRKTISPQALIISR